MESKQEMPDDILLNKIWHRLGLHTGTPVDVMNIIEKAGKKGLTSAAETAALFDRLRKELHK